MLYVAVERGEGRSWGYLCGGVENATRAEVSRCLPFDNTGRVESGGK